MRYVWEEELKTYPMRAVWRQKIVLAITESLKNRFFFIQGVKEGPEGGTPMKVFRYFDP